MKKLLLSSVAFASLTAGAMAADLPSRRIAPAPYVAVPVFTWTGFYAGVNAGYGFHNSDDNGFGAFSTGTGLAAVGPVVTTGVNPVAGGTFGGNSGRDRDGFVGGGQIGYNYQIGSVVLGVEGDIQYTDFGRRNLTNGGFGTAFTNANIAPVQPGAAGNVAFFNGSNKSDFYGSVRGRLGYAFDRVLVYATGGVAFRDTDSDHNGYFNGYNTAGYGRPDDVGYVVGGGVEYAFTPSLTGRIEGMYVNFGGNRGTNYGGGTVVGVTNLNVPIVATGYNRNRDDDFAVVRAGINYKFNAF